jgi:uncharacterized membrane protein (Fun14 family)
MASLLVIRRSVSKNVLCDMSNLIKSKINRMKILPRSRTLLNISKIGFSSLFVGYYILNNNQSHCAAKKEDDDNNKESSDKDDEITVLIHKFSPLATKLGFGGIMGFMAGAALKRFGEEAAVYIGVAFIGLQALQYLGYINIDYRKLTKDLEKKLDVTGDGKLDVNDALVVWKEIKKILSFNLPSAGGFSLGVALGIYYY